MMTLPTYPWRFAHLAALWAFGVSQPVFSMLKGNPEFLVVRGSTRDDVVVFALLLAFVPPLLVVGLEAIAGLCSAMLSRALHIVAVWSLGFLAALQVVRLLDVSVGVAFLVPMLLAAVIAIAYLRWDGFRSALALSSILPVLGAAHFVVTVPLAIADREGANVPVRTSTPIVLVVFDEFPLSSLLRADGSLDEQRYPNFGALARDGVWYPRATSVHEFTTHAVPAVLTGIVPSDRALPTLSDHPDNLFTLLGERYAFDVVEPLTRLCPSRYCPESRPRASWADRLRGLLYDTGIAYLYRVLPTELQLELPPIGGRWGGFAEGAGMRERLLGALDQNDVNLALEAEDHEPRSDFERFLAGIHRGERRRTLHFAHLNLPHTPFRVLPSGREYGNAATVDGILDDAFNNWSTSPGLVEQALQRHLLQVGYVDRLLGLLVARLRDAGLYDRALVIVTADHGASFEPGGSRRYVTRDNVADIASVPLFVKYPGARQGRVDTRSANLTDVVPTIAAVIGARIPWHVDGRSLLASPLERRVSVGRRAGGAVIESARSAEERVRATAKRNAALFGEGADSLYRIGPHRSLHGRTVASIAGPSSSTFVARLDGSSLYADVRPRTGFVPARVVGEFEGNRPKEGTPLAISVNGRIAATTRTFQRGGQTHFAALVPEQAFRAGPNDVEVLLVQSTASRLRLVRVGGTGSVSRYVLSSDATSVILPSGRRVGVTRDSLEGQVESTAVEAGILRIRGWAADVRNAGRVDRVLLFAGPRLVYSSDTPIIRWDLGPVSSTRGLQRVGFGFELPLRHLEGSTLRAIAVRGDVASELDWRSRGGPVKVSSSAR